MRGHKPFAVVVDELQQVSLLLVVNRHFAMPHEEDRVDIVEAGAAAGRLPGSHLRMVGSDVGIGANVGVPQTRFVAEPFDDGQCMRYRIVLRDAVACVGPRQHHLTPGGAPAPAASDRRLGRAHPVAARWAESAVRG